MIGGEKGGNNPIEFASAHVRRGQRNPSLSPGRRRNERVGWLVGIKDLAIDPSVFYNLRKYLAL